MKAEIISVGTELTRGEIVDTNSAWLSRELAEVGFEARLHTTVDDDEEHLLAAINHSAGDSDLVIITGGIGPTPDDITRYAVARAAGVPLVLDADLVAWIRSLFASWGREMNPANAVQAEIPRGATVVPNPRGTAPGFIVTVGRAEVVVLPGVPSEMKGMWAATVRPRLAGRGGEVLVTRTLNCFGRGESDITEAIKDLMAPGRNPSVGDTAEDMVIKIRIRARAATHEAALSMIAATKAEIRRRLGDVIWGEDDDTFESVVVSALISRRQTVSIAESCTGGLIAKRLTDISGASAVFTQGLVTYSNESKTALLGVPRELIAAHGAVSDPVARAMAEACRARAGTDYAIAVTGIAGPSGGTPAKPVGLVFVAVYGPNGTVAKELRLRGDREQVRDRSAKWALSILHTILTRT